MRGMLNRLLHSLARISPGATTVRPCIHRWRGVRVGADVFIGEDVYIENEFPDCVEIQENVQISIRAIIIAHTRGPGRVIIERDAFVGPNSVIIAGADRTVRIGRGAVVGAGSVITRSVPPGLYVSPPAPKAVARVRVPLPVAKSMGEFLAGLAPIRRRDDAGSQE
jgi:acetyltransferase-like isoleucine patch superfamily enzyme